MLKRGIMIRWGTDDERKEGEEEECRGAMWKPWVLGVARSCGREASGPLLTRVAGLDF